MITRTLLRILLAIIGFFIVIWTFNHIDAWVGIALAVVILLTIGLKLDKKLKTKK